MGGEKAVENQREWGAKTAYFMRPINQRRSKRGGGDRPSVGTIVGDIEEKKIERRTVFFFCLLRFYSGAFCRLLEGELLNYEKSHE